MKLILIATGLSLALGVGVAVLPRALAVDGDDKAVVEASSKRPDYAALYKEVKAGQTDPLSIPRTDGIVWYGTWEDAMAEKERTGKPVMLHFGSPRCPKDGVNVPGTW